MMDLANCLSLYVPTSFSISTKSRAIIAIIAVVLLPKNQQYISHNFLFIGVLGHHYYFLYYCVKNVFGFRLVS